MSQRDDSFLRIRRVHTRFRSNRAVAVDEQRLETTGASQPAVQARVRQVSRAAASSRSVFGVHIRETHRSGQDRYLSRVKESYILMNNNRIN